MNKWTYLLLTLIVIGGFLLRIYKLTEIPPALNQDEAVSGYDAFAIIHTFKDHHGNFFFPVLQSFNDWASPFITYVNTISVAIFGLSVFSIRLSVVILGTLSILIFYYICFILSKDKYISLIGALIIACSGILIHYSRWSIQPSTVPFTTLLFLLFSLFFLEKPNSYFRLLSFSLTAAIATYTYPTQKLFIPLTLVIYSLLFFKQLKNKLLELWLIYLLIALPILLTAFSDKYNVRFLQVTLRQASETEGGIIRAFFNRYLNYLNPNYLFGSGDPDKRFQPSGTRIIGLYLLPFYFMGLASMIIQIVLKKRILPTPNKVIAFILLLGLLAPIPASLTKDKSHLLRDIQAIPITYIFIFIGMYLVQTSLLTEKWIKSFYLFLVCFFIAIGTQAYAKVYFTNYSSTINKDFQFGLYESFNFLIKNDSKFQKVVIDTNINQPYIYYLFFSRFDPKKLTTVMVEKQTFGKYSFTSVDDSKIKSLPLVFTFKYKNEVFYQIFNDHGVWYLKKSYTFQV